MMKTTFFSILLTALLVFVMYSCDDDPKEEKVPDEITGQLIQSSECKFKKATQINQMTPDSLSCVEYSLNEESHVLLMTHVNAGFNCCPGNLSCTFSFNNDTIIITEHEEKAECNCDCLFDLDMELEGVMNKKYMVKFIEPYAYEVEPLLFEMDLTENNEGSYCVTRKSYPWGQLIF